METKAKNQSPSINNEDMKPINPTPGPSFVYKSVPVSAGTQGLSVAQACAIADPAETAAAEMITMDGAFCHFGNSSTNSSTPIASSASSWDVYIKPGKSINCLQVST